MHRSPSTRQLWLGVSALLLVNALSQGLMSGTADRDQAEQLLLAQHWALGYGAQPPLYTYLVKLLFLVTGPALWPLLTLKALLLCLLVGAVLAVGVQLGFRRDQQLLALAGLALIPQLAWESQRDLSHTVLATTLAAAALLQLLRLARQPSRAQGALLGALLAGSLLGKYNAALFALGLLLTAASIPQLRRPLLRVGLLPAAATAAVLLAPHLWWVLQHPGYAGAELAEAGGLVRSPWPGVRSALANATAFLSPWLLGALALLWPERRRLRWADPRLAPGQALLQRLPLVVMGVVLLAVVAGGIDSVKDRWFQPLLFYAPISVASLLPPLPPRRQRWVVATALAAALTAALLLPGRTPLVAITGHTSRPNLPLPELVRSLTASGPPPGAILASGTLLAGNARLVHPTVPVFSATGSTPATPWTGGPLLVLLDGQDDPAVLAPALERLVGPDARLPPLRERSLPLHWAPQLRHSLRYGWLLPAEAP